ncbi:hypothetical protein TNCV_1957641 [Trichonephila clavipes]|nr:hypothetical protein TNCV_1957641 [Trichonephila clavipes]
MKPYHDPAEQIENRGYSSKESYKGPITHSRIKTLNKMTAGRCLLLKEHATHHNLLQVPIAELAGVGLNSSGLGVHTGYFSNIRKCVKRVHRQLGCSQSSVVSSPQRPKREIRRSPNVSSNKSIVARAVCDMLRSLVGTTARHHRYLFNPEHWKMVLSGLEDKEVQPLNIRCKKYADLRSYLPSIELELCVSGAQWLPKPSPDAGPEIRMQK